MKNLDSATNN